MQFDFSLSTLFVIFTSCSLKLRVKSLHPKQYVVRIGFQVFIGFIFDFVFFMFYIGGKEFYASYSARLNLLVNSHFKYFISPFSSFNSFISASSSLIFLFDSFFSSPFSFIFLFDFLSFFYFFNFTF